MNSWINEQDNGVLVDWIVRTTAPMMACLPDGRILWVNRAFEDMTGYTLAELERVSWADLTFDHEDTQADIAMAELMKSGDRVSYRMTKQYKRKSNRPVKVIVDVLRYPVYGDFKCSLVTSIPLDQGIDFALIQITEVRELIMQMIAADREPKIDVSALWKWMNENKFAAAVIAVVLSFLLFGDRVFEIVSRFMDQSGGT